MILWMILNLSGNGPICDLTLSMTGLYFFLVAANMFAKSEGMAYSSQDPNHWWKHCVMKVLDECQQNDNWLGQSF